MKTRSHLLTLLSLLIGGLLFVLVVQQTGTRELWERVRTLDARFAWILAASAVRPVLRAYAWLRCLQEEERQAGFFSLWRARLIGDAIGNLTTAGPLLAEPARLVFLGGHVPFQAAAASLSLELVSYLFSACLMMLAGLIILLATGAVAPVLRTASIIAAAVLLVVVLCAAWLWWRRWSLVGNLRKVSARAGGLHRLIQTIHHKIEPLWQRLLQLERHNLEFYRQRPRDFALVCLCEAGFHFFGVVEIWLTLHLLGAPVSPLTAFIFEAVNRIINVAFTFVPVKLGVDEAGTGLLAGALGFGSVTGVALAVYRKLRVLFWTALGLLLLLSLYVQRRLGKVAET